MRTSTQRSGGVFECELIDDRPGLATIAVTGEGAYATFIAESGGHRWQRIPPTERKGRVHTSTVTVAVLNTEVNDPTFNKDDVDITTTRGSAPGGQHRNKVETCVVATHRPSGITVRIDGRSQHQNRQLAYRVLSSKLADVTQQRAQAMQDADRKQQVGTGMRGDKVRTYRVQDDKVTDHRTGQKLRLSDWLKGAW